MGNVMYLTGMVATRLSFSHAVLEEEFYTFDVETKRTSGTTDTIKVITSERLIDLRHIREGKRIRVTGEFRSRNDNNHLILTVFATDISPVDDDVPDSNEISLSGYIAKPPTLRDTPLSRTISDVLLAVPRRYGKNDYIPCVVWGRNAKYTSTLDTGTLLTIDGRIQSRTYNKNGEIHTAYEISVSNIR